MPACGVLSVVIDLLPAATCMCVCVCGMLSLLLSVLIVNDQNGTSANNTRASTLQSSVRAHERVTYTNPNTLVVIACKSLVLSNCFDEYMGR